MPGPARKQELYRTDVALSRQTLDSVQWLRLLAALLVVAYHTDLQLLRLYGAEAQRAHFGAGGVDLFFVISGFIMVYTTERKPPHAMTFLMRRFIRIVPLYWLFTTLTLLLVLLAPRLFHSTALDVHHIVSSYLMLAHPHPVTGELRPLLVPGWTLNAEMFFYLLFGATLMLSLLQRVIAISFVLAALVVLSWSLDRKGSLLAFYGAPLMLEFAAGCCIGWLVTRTPIARTPTLLALVVIAAMFAGAGIAYGISEQASRLFYWGVPSALLLYVCVALNITRGWPDVPVLRLGGDASYSIYLSHLFVLGALGAVYAKIGVSAAGPEPIRMSMLIASTIVGTVTYLWIERPLLRALTQRLTKPKAGLHVSDATR